MFHARSVSHRIFFSALTKLTGGSNLSGAFGDLFDQSGDFSIGCFLNPFGSEMENTLMFRKNIRRERRDENQAMYHLDSSTGRGLYDGTSRLGGRCPSGSMAGSCHSYGFARSGECFDKTLSIPGTGTIKGLSGLPAADAPRESISERACRILGIKKSLGTAELQPGVESGAL